MRKSVSGTLALTLGVLLMHGFPTVSASGQEWTTLDRIVAAIGDSPVLLTDLQLEEDLGLLEPAAGRTGIEGLLTPYLNRLLIQEEIEEVGSFRVSDAQLEGAFRGYMAGFASREEYMEKTHRWGIGDKEVRKRLARALTVSLYTESRIKFFVRVFPTEIERAYSSDPERWAGMDLNQAWDQVRESLEAEAFEREKERWLATLKDRYRLQVFAGDNGG